jgi:uncharacterized integral membrane protein
MSTLDTRDDQRLQRAGRTRSRGGPYVWVFVLVALLVVLVALAVDNTGSVELGWVLGASRAPLVWVILFSAILGWLVGIATSMLIRHSTRPRR